MTQKNLNISISEFKYFFYNAKKIRTLYIFLPKMSAYQRDFDGTKYMSFLIKDDEFLKKCTIKFGLKIQ